MKLSIYNLSKNQTSVIKGISMVLIVLHNFIHWTSNIDENLMALDLNNTYAFIDAIQFNPIVTFNALISYFASFTLCPLIFITGFGLMKKYQQGDTIPYFKFVFTQFKKIYILLLIGLVSYFIFDFIKNISYLLSCDYPLSYSTIRYSIHTRFWLGTTIEKLLMYQNFSFHTVYKDVGPWWYFSLILQLYLLFPFLFKLIQKLKEKGAFILLCASFLLIYALVPLAQQVDFPIYANFPGHLPSFILGMIVAKYKDIFITTKVVIVAIILFVLGNFYQLFFHLFFQQES